MLSIDKRRKRNIQGSSLDNIVHLFGQNKKISSILISYIVPIIWTSKNLVKNLFPAFFQSSSPYFFAS